MCPATDPPTGASDDAHSDAMFLRLYAELRNIAGRLLRGEAEGHTLQPTALVHEAWLKLAGEHGLRPADRQHFLALAARAMRQVLVDSARRRRAAKRGGAAVNITLSDDVSGRDMPLDDLIAVDDALVQLAANDERLARVVELRFFAGLSEEEIASALDVTTRTVQRDWARARAWLHSELSLRAPDS
jgi:RNA polymerase sigma factor (TIGR02999 family)